MSKCEENEGEEGGKGRFKKKKKTALEEKRTIYRKCSISWFQKVTKMEHLSDWGRDGNCILQQFHIIEVFPGENMLGSPHEPLLQTLHWNKPGCGPDGGGGRFITMKDGMLWGTEPALAPDSPVSKPTKKAQRQ